ncbi:glycosyltransferase [Herbiconiux sp. KACC 21604]|uniref:glycosyltransferase n=1 Tax=unclassified Herbiconiux TaxID=2618217 RepID=UPI0014929ACA|nr:nucleotide disphospho-sugar-binding domain-containing protein [Herbiconiux sp. SALV-R1]QJU52288.1 glycosyltransferase [Herbiconiux sp. SALV-R1]WPO87136.1 glycosyltransferase [Herbiconiux sp. KACC 21604]
MSSYLLCSTPVHGHVTPLLAVARHLADGGHRVRFLTGARYRASVESTGALFLPLPAEADYDDSDMNASFPERAGLSGPAGIRFDLATIFLRPAPAQLAAIDAALAAEPVDAILLESLFLGSLPLLDRPLGQRPPVVNLGIVPLALDSVDTAPFGLGIAPRPGFAGRVRNRLLSFVAQKIVFAPVQKAAEQMMRATTGHELETFFMSTPAQADAIVQFTVPSFEYPRSDLPDTVHFVGPLARTAPSTTPLPEWWGEVDGSRPVVHVTQGTVANRDWNELVAPAMAGLAHDDVLVVVSTGGREVGSLPHPLPANVRAASYLPYDKLLPLTSVLVTNGGYGGVHYAMEHGVPLVVAGTTEDKIEVTARVAWSGVGVNLKTSTPSAEAVGSAVREVLGRPGYREASARIGRDIVASPGLAGLDAVLESLSGSAARRPGAAR